MENDPTKRAPFVVFAFPGDPIPTEELILSLVKEDDRWREVIIIPVQDHEEAMSAYQATRTPWQIFVTASTPVETMTFFQQPSVLSNSEG